MKNPGTNRFMLRLALLIAPFAVVDGASAACAPASPVDNVTVTCTGTTTDQNGTTGMAPSTVPSQAIRAILTTSTPVRRCREAAMAWRSLTSAPSTIPEPSRRRAWAATASLGQVSNGTVNNAGVISATGASSVGVVFGVLASSTTLQAFQACSEALFLQNGVVTNDRAGTIAGGNDGVNIVDAAASVQRRVISGGQLGINIGAGFSQPLLK